MSRRLCSGVGAWLETLRQTGSVNVTFPSVQRKATGRTSNVGQNLWSVRVGSCSVARESHPSQDASHKSEAGDHSWHRIFRMNFIFQIDEALVLRRDESFKHFPHRHDAVSHCDLTFLALEIRKVLHVYVE